MRAADLGVGVEMDAADDLLRKRIFVGIAMRDRNRPYAAVVRAEIDLTPICDFRDREPRDRVEGRIEIERTGEDLRRAQQKFTLAGRLALNVNVRDGADPSLDRTIGIAL